MVIAEQILLKRHKEKLLLVGLVLLLGVQLTGLTCLGEWHVVPATALVEATDLSPSPDGAVTDDGCPCHFVFQSVSLLGPEILFPLTDDLIFSSRLYVPAFLVTLFHPPILI